MCGIAGYFNPGGISRDTNILGAMAQAIAHRGPDHQGLHQDDRCARASRSLAIIDEVIGILSSFRSAFAEISRTQPHPAPPKTSAYYAR